MIKSRKGNVKIKGETHEVLADFATIARNMKSALLESGISEENAKSCLDNAYRRGMMSSEELEKELLKVLVDFLSEEEEKE